MNSVASHRIAAQCLVASVLVLLTFPVNAETITGHVVSVADGDTIALLDAGTVQHRIRLAGIDAPEKGQAFGSVSRQYMAELAFGKQAKADCYKTDRYGRLVCTVYVDGKNTSAWRNSTRDWLGGIGNTRTSNRRRSVLNMR